MCLVFPILVCVVTWHLADGSARSSGYRFPGRCERGGHETITRKCGNGKCEQARPTWQDFGWKYTEFCSDEENVHTSTDDVGSQSTRINVDQLSAYIKLKHTHGEGFKDEFYSIPGGSLHPVTVASASANIDKNRYKKIKPYDKSRVVLEAPGDGYINACFIPGYTGNDKHYIAGQGSLPNTIADTWRMIWQYDVARVVTIANEKELEKKKCERYWPNTEGECHEYGDMLITLLDEEAFTDFTLRTIKCTKKGESRKVTHFHFTSWPDMQTPDTALALLKFRYKVNSFPKKGPLFVHCSAGVGRSGTYLAIDYLIEQGLAEGKVDVLRCVTKLRDYRMNMVETTAQYEFIYKVLLEAFTSSGAAIPGNELDTNIGNLGPKISQQLKWIDSAPPYAGEPDGLEQENIYKTRDKSKVQLIKEAV